MSATVTPAMRQYLDAKQQHRDAILLFRMGDFYEMFYEDALVAARALELTLTSRSKDANGGGIPMCGVPFHAVDGYIARLVKKRLPRRDLRSGRGSAQGQGHRQARGRPRRLAGHADRRQLPRRARAGVPDGGRARAGGERRDAVIGVALLDLSTGEFSAAEYAGADGLQALADELAVLRPREIIVPSGDNGAPAAAIPPVAASGLPIDADRRLGVRARRGAADAARSAARRRPRRLRPRRPPGRRRRRRRARPPPARHAEGRPRARALDRLPPARRRAARSIRRR